MRAALPLRLVLCTAIAAGAAAARADPMDVACAQASTEAQREAVAAAQAMLAARWLETERGWFVRYRTRGVPRHPFALPSTLPESAPPRSGILQASAATCTLTQEAGREAVVVVFRAALYRFNEEGGGWTRPLRDGVMMALALTPRADASGASRWQITDLKPTKAVLEADQPTAKPTVGELPADAPWPEPLPGCKRSERWTGTSCVSKRAR